MEQSGARVAQQQLPVSVNETHDDHEDFHLFGSAPLSISTVTTTTTTTTTVAQIQPVNAEPSSPSNYELFPMAAAGPTEKEREQVEALPVKEAPIQITRATAPADEERVEDGGFELFPMAAVVKTLESSESVVTDTSEYSMYSGSASFSRSNSTPAAVTAATYATAAPLSPSHKVSGNAVDIIAVRSTENEYFTTPWHVAFGWSRFRSNITTGVGDMVRVFVNGKELPTKMQLLERGRCAFVTGGLTPPVGDLLFADLSEEHPNYVRFEHYQKSSDTFRYVESRLHIWGPNESVVVADLDGTLTISDVEGHIRTLRLGQYDFLHKGACDFFTKLHELDMKIVYLTARPIDWATASRTHLENATQHSHSLPPGPLITNSNGLTGALFTEVVNKNPHVFKAHVLNEIQLTLIHAGRVVEHPVFVAGFGNRPTDIIAYENVGMDPSLIFMLDPYSNLKASSDPRIYESYSDPNALLWLLPRLKHRVPIEKVARIDDYTVRELVLAEDREQLLMAERQARALQEEEYERARARGEGNVGGSSLTRVLYGSYNA